MRCGGSSVVKRPSTAGTRVFVGAVSGIARRVYESGAGGVKARPG
jgi:hypothetical protein